MLYKKRNKTENIAVQVVKLSNWRTMLQCLTVQSDVVLKRYIRASAPPVAFGVFLAMWQGKEKKKLKTET